MRYLESIGMAVVLAFAGAACDASTGAAGLGDAAADAPIPAGELPEADAGDEEVADPDTDEAEDVPEVVELAVPCAPCAVDADCGGESRCVAVGLSGGAPDLRCVLPCDGGCGEGTSCDAAAGVCLPDTGSCICFGEDAAGAPVDGSIRACTVTNDHGTCYGSETCQGSDGWTGCTAATPAPEVCNGVDDDCSGQVDDGFPDTDFDQLRDCVDKDDDADGVPDTEDGCPLVPDPSQADFDGDGTGDACDLDSDADGSPAGEDCDDLDPDVYPNHGELCNGKEDDCDGLTDEGYADTDADGVADCIDPDDDGDGDPDETDCDALDPTIHHGATEVCDGADSDCNGTVDDVAGLGSPCDGPDQDACEGGTLECLGKDLICAGDTSGKVELCNGEDDDCDGVADEDFPDKGSPCDGPDSDGCPNGLWECDGKGLVCTDDTFDDQEICNDLDDDCDGKTDEDFPAKGGACDGLDADLCMDGVFVCKNKVLACDDGQSAFVESCNDVDDDCDGATDEPFPQKGQPCDGPDPDEVPGGTWVCSPGGGVACDEP